MGVHDMFIALPGLILQWQLNLILHMHVYGHSDAEIMKLNKGHGTTMMQVEGRVKNSQEELVKRDNEIDELRVSPFSKCKVSVYVGLTTSSCQFLHDCCVSFRILCLLCKQTWTPHQRPTTH